MSSHWDIPMGPWTKQPRFYPPGQHPAMFQTYAWLVKAERCLADVLFAEAKCGTVFAKDGLLEAIAYAQERIAAFEERESELKLEAALRGR